MNTDNFYKYTNPIWIVLTGLEYTLVGIAKILGWINSKVKMFWFIYIELPKKDVKFCTEYIESYNNHKKHWNRRGTNRLAKLKCIQIVRKSLK